MPHLDRALTRIAREVQRNQWLRDRDSRCTRCDKQLTDQDLPVGAHLDDPGGWECASCRLAPPQF